MANAGGFSMARVLLLPLGLLTLILVGHSPAAPAPKPKPRGAEALLYVKRVPGRTNEQQAEIRKQVRYHLSFGLDQWMFSPDTELPGLKEPTSISNRAKWQSENVQLAWVEDTGVLRLSCRAGWPRERALFVNNAVKHIIASYEEHKKGVKMHLASIENLAKALSTDLKTDNAPVTRRALEGVSKKIPQLQRSITDLSEIVILDLADVPPR
jgi:hypothetical protein